MERGRPLPVDLPSFASEGAGAESSRVAGMKTTGGPGAEGKASETENVPFVLNSVLPVVPPRLVKKIVRGDFVDMAELLRNNLEA